MSFRLLLALTFIASSALFAGEAPNCDSPLVRLSRIPISCLGSVTDKFDIPALKINFSDIEKIVQGAESSGGRRRPDISNLPMQPMGISKPTHSCEARLLIDSQTRVSWLLSQEIEVGSYQSLLTPSSWSPGLTTSSDPFGPSLPVIVRPDVGLLDVSAYTLQSEVSLCYGNIACAQTQLKAGEDTVLKLQVLSGNLKFTIALSCQEI